jgi:ferredoxin-fold anticodon binding domain-containing protein
MKGMEIKVTGHIIEKGILGILFGALKDKQSDITDIEILASTLKGSWDEKCPSIMTFKLVSFEEEDLKKSYQEVLELLKENGCRLIYRKDI